MAIQTFPNFTFSFENRLRSKSQRTNSVFSSPQNRYINKKTIGMGSFGTIFSCQDTLKKQHVAVKQLDLVQAEKAGAIKSIEIEI